MKRNREERRRIEKVGDTEGEQVKTHILLMSINSDAFARGFVTCNHRIHVYMAYVDQVTRIEERKKGKEITLTMSSSTPARLSEYKISWPCGNMA